ncbi:MAG TPA: M23 family metallopeptidase [Geomonas sp.]|nr:M23 family metallopeptidase [Geomonas sp.]
MVSRQKVKSLVIAVLFSALLPAAASADLDLPVKGVITSGVGWRVDPFGSGKLVFHRGVDIAVPVGTAVHATRRGRVVFAGERHGYGAAVIVEHANGDRTLYGHNSVVAVHRGDLVEAGAVIAYSGNSGRSTGPHVHFEKIPSGRPGAEEAVEVASEEAVPRQPAASARERELLEQSMEKSVQSILKAVRNSTPGGEGG